ncbi:hypothetical protein T265_12904, partial [Opisthorchis viverrini]
MHPSCSGRPLVTRSPRVPDVRSSNPDTAIVYVFLVIYNSSKPQFQWLLSLNSSTLKHSENTFACSNGKIQMHPSCSGRPLVTRSPRVPDVRSSNPDTAIVYVFLVIYNSSKPQFQWLLSLVSPRGMFGVQTPTRPLCPEFISRHGYWICTADEL